MPGDLGFSRLQASLAQATQEFTVAAANVNFDFTLFKIQALPEYQDIATVLSPSRVHEAETGPLHATAMRLGALFEGVCPKTPNLIKAYGLRASEISREVVEAESKKTQRTQDKSWIQTQYGGIDATSIWAAATSSKAALPVHLLACIIARMWLPTEATSMWTEVIADRKREILADAEQGEWFHPALLAAVKQEITREQLAKWDSSTRAWLQSADSTALSTMEGLILGRPHVVRDAPVLLGLSAWHIFPDMVVFDSQSGNTSVRMNDALVREGGILSLGFSDPGPQEHQGVYWSLSLAHHTFYGKPTLLTRRLDSDGSRLSLDEFILVCMGSLLGSWRVPICETSYALRIIKAIQAIPTILSTPGSPPANLRKPTSVMTRAFKAYHDADQQAILATSLGRRRPKFIPPEVLHGRKPFFELTHLPTLLYVIDDTEHKIHLLRRLASRVTGLNYGNSIISCFRLSGSKRGVVFASACAKPSENRDEVSSKKRSPVHCRWVYPPKEAYERACRKAKENAVRRMDSSVDGSEEPMAHSASQEILVSRDEFYKDYLGYLEREHREKVEYLESGDFEGDSKPWFHDTLTQTVTFGYSDSSYGYLIGQRDDCELTDHHPTCDHASLCCRGYGNSDEPRQHFAVPELTLEDVLWCFESGFVSPTHLERVLKGEPAFGFLQVLSSIYSAYEDLAACGATICSAIVHRPFRPPVLDYSGASDTWPRVTNNLKIKRHFMICLIAYFETADNIAHGLKDDSRIIGLSGGDSIFVLSKLVNDPGTKCSSHTFTRILGNTGHPGFSVFITPANPKAREIDPAAWRIEPSPFDDTYVDCFKGTSLHLSFTEWRAPVIQVQAVGQREAYVNLVEAVISVRDSGRWVADVDISAALWLNPAPNDELRRGQPELYLSGKNAHCNHRNGTTEDEPRDNHKSIMAIETWDQVLDVPDGVVVVRSSKNWLARLALVSVLRQHSQMLQSSIFVWPDRLCRQCVHAAGHAVHIC